MLKKRLIATLIVRNGIIVQSVGFRKYLPVGKPEIAVEFLNSWGIDEIVLLDITASNEKTGPNFAIMDNVTRSCFVPLTIGGGITSVGQIQRFLNLGADKVCINSAALEKPEFVTEAANVFGNQCIIVSIDVIGASVADYKVFDAYRGCAMRMGPIDWAREVESMGAGEIYLTSVNRDGSKAGYDLDLIEPVVQSVDIPVIASGGAGHPGHVLEVFKKTNASAVSAANFFHFSEHSVITTKALLRDAFHGIRLNTHADYEGCSFDPGYRLKKRSDDYLEDLLYERIEAEVI